MTAAFSTRAQAVRYVERAHSPSEVAWEASPGRLLGRPIGPFGELIVIKRVPLRGGHR
jgi:hypothetical protein